MDTVPGLIPVRESKGRLYGRGAVDAKGALATYVLAAHRVAQCLSEACVYVIGVVEEEAHGRGARHLAQTMPAPCCTIIGEPSDWEAITLGYKHPGAAESAASFWHSLKAFAHERNNGRSGRFDTLDPRLRGFNTVSDGLHDRADMRIDIRLPPGMPAAELKRKIKLWRNGAQTKYYPTNPPFEADKNTPLVRAMLQAIRAEGGRPRFKLKTGTTDMNIVGPVWRCPIVAYGPGDSSLDHTPNENIKIDEFLKAIDVLERALAVLVR
jgi:LysW-gamma-L-lysine carboxypeptidase